MIWRLFICCECDTDDGVVVMQVPDDAPQDRGCPIDFCPGCGGYLSIIGMGEVEVSGTSLAHLRMREPAEQE